MKTLVEQFRDDNNALKVTSTIESMLKQKTLEAIEEARKQVAAEAFGESLTSEINETTKVSKKEDPMGVADTLGLPTKKNPWGKKPKPFVKGKPSLKKESVDVNEELIHGKKLTPDQHKKVLSAYVHRFTGEHKPAWAKEKMP